MKNSRLLHNSRIPFPLASAIAAMLATLPQMSQAAVRTWANAGTAWATAANWGGTVPGTNDDALFNSASYTGFQPAFTTASLGMFRSTGAGAITFTGNQILTLSANGSTVGTGILLGSGAGAVNFSGVRFALGATQSWTNNSSNLMNANGTITLGANTLTFNGSGNGGFNLNGVISGTGNLITNQSSGTLTLGGANSFTGNTTITAGTLIVGSGFAGKLGGNATTYAGSITNNGAFIYKTNTSQTYSGVISGSGSLTKDTSSTFDSSGLSVLTLSNASNTYTGATNITAGTLSVSANGNLGASAANLVFNGGTLQITGTALTNFSGMGRTVLFNSGKNVSLDINSNAHTFTVDQALNQGTGGFIKAGAGTVILNAANTYTGNTIVNAGVLRYDSTSAISGSGRNVIVNPGGAVQFAPFSNADIATALGRIDTTSKGTIDPTNNLSGTFDFNTAGLANTSLGAGGTTGLNVDFTGTLTPFGTTYRLGGTNSSTNNIRMATANQLSGANDVVVTGGVVYTTNQNYSGSTSLNSGTLQLSGPNGAITSGAGGITFNGGALTLTNAVAENAVVRVPVGTAITSNGGTFNYNNTSNAGTVYTQSVGSVAITTGQLDTVLGTNMLGGSGNAQTLTLAGLTRASSATGTATFSATTTGPNATTNMIKVTGGTASTNIGPWATVGTTAALQTDYAAYDASKNIVGAAIAGSAESTWTSSSTLYTNATAAVTLGATRNMLGLRNTGTTTVMNVASGINLNTYGLLNGVSTLWTIQQSGGAGVVTTPNGGGNLFITTGSGAITISAPVTNSADSAAVSLVKSGSGTLTLSGTNTYTGGTFINAGTLTTSNANALGTNRAVTLANVAGATLNLTAANIAIGSLNGGGANGGNVVTAVTLAVGGDNSNSNYAGSISGGFGALQKTGSGTLTLSGNNTYGSSQTNTGVASTDLTAGTVVIDTTNPFGNWTVALNGNTLVLQAATTARTVANRIWLNGTTTTVSGSQSLTFSGDVMNRGGNATLTNNITGGGTLSLTGNLYTDWGSGAATTTFNGSANTNISAPIANNINNFAGINGNITMSGSGILTLSNTASTYTGVTTINSGVIAAAALANGGTASSIGQSTNAASNLVFGAPTATLRYNGSSNATTNRGFTLSSGAGGGATIESSGSGTLTIDNTVAMAYGSSNETRLLTLGGTNTGANTFSKVIANNGSSATSLTKAGAGQWVLGGTNTYTGATTVSAGKLAVNGSTSASSAVGVSSGAALGGSGTVGGNTTIASGGTLAPGNSPGVLTIAGTTTLNSGSMFEWEIDTAQISPETNRGVAYDGLNTSALIGSGAIFKIMLTGDQNFTDAFWSQTRTWTDIFKSANGSTNLSDWASVFSGGFQYSYNGQNVQPTAQGAFTMNGSSLTWSAVPEPSNAIIGLLAATGLLRRRRMD